MDFFIQSALAEAPAAGASSDAGIMGFLPLIILFVVFYFLLIRPQQKRAKEHTSMVDTLKKGDEVVTNGGILGTVTEVGDNFIVVQVDTDTNIKVQRQAISSIVPKGTGDSL
jgi:preprotein translocase subunit YajC